MKNILSGYLIKKKHLVFLAGILLLGLFLRLYGIHWGLPNEQHFFSYSPDEYSVFQRLQQMDVKKFDFNIHAYFNTAPFFYLIAIIFKVLSFVKVVILTSSREFYHYHTGEWAKLYLTARLVVVLIGVATVYLVYLVGKSLYNNKIGMIAALLFSILPLHVVFSKQIIVDIFVTFLVVLDFLLLSKVLISNSWKWHVLASVFIALTLVTKITTIFLLPFISICYALRENSFKIDRKIIVSYGIVLLAYFIFNPYLLFNLKEAKQHLLICNDIATKQWVNLGYGFSWQNYSLANFGFTVPLFLVVLGGIFLALLKRGKSDIILLTWIVVNYLVIVKTGTPIIKYYLIIAPFMLILGSRFIIFMIDKRGLLRILTMCAFIITILSAFLYSFAYSQLLIPKDVRDEASDWIIRNIPKGAKIGVTREPFYFSPPIVFSQYFYTGKSEFRQFPQRYKINNLNYDLEALKTAEPDYIVISDAEYRDILRPQDKFNKDTDYRFIQEIFDKGKFIKVASFQREPNCLGFNFAMVKPPKDWKFVYPTIIILKRK